MLREKGRNKQCKNASAWKVNGWVEGKKKGSIMRFLWILKFITSLVDLATASGGLDQCVE